MPDQFSHTSDGELRPAGAIVQGTDGAWWDEFFTEWPDENLAEWFSGVLLGLGRVLELG